MDEQRTHEFRKARRAAYRAERDPADPVAFEFEHEETGEVKFIEATQVEIGFQKENPCWQLIGPVYAQAPAVAVNEQMLMALVMITDTIPFQFMGEVERDLTLSAIAAAKHLLSETHNLNIGVLDAYISNDIRQGCSTSVVPG